MKKELEQQGISVIKKLAEGGQGEIFHISNDGKERVLKLYNNNCSTPQQKELLQKLIFANLPDVDLLDRFAYPEEMIEMRATGRFGYIMRLINTQEYISVMDVESHRAAHPGFGICVEVGRQLAEVSEAIHRKGWCLRDISKNNLLFSPTTGNIVMLDNDSFAVNGYQGDNMEGTPGYAAPEILRGEASPSTLTDLHSLAVLLFQLLCWHDPFKGERARQIEVINKDALDDLYGYNPTFIFDPVDQSNRLPDVGGYRNARTMWNVLPDYIKALFTRSFTTGLHTPELRVLDKEWANALTLLQGQRHVCQCGAENFYDPKRRQQRPCWHKQCRVDYPEKLFILGEAAGILMIKEDQQLRPYHIGEYSRNTVVGRMENCNHKNAKFQLRNQSTDEWWIYHNDTCQRLAPSKAIPLKTGMRIRTKKRELIVAP